MRICEISSSSQSTRQKRCIKVKYKEYKQSEAFNTADIVELYDKTGSEIEITGETRRRELNNKAVLDRKRRTENGLTIDTVVLDVKEKK